MRLPFWVTLQFSVFLVIASNGGHRKSELGARQSVLRTPVIARGFSPVAIRSSFKGEADSFTLRAQNDKPFSCHECRKVCAVSCCLVIANTVRCVAIRFPLFKPLHKLKAL